jgi:hypothetical protein
MDVVVGPVLRTVLALGKLNTESNPDAAISVNCAGPAFPVIPVGPVGPVGPVLPVDPVGPVGPVEPVGPVHPVGPVFPNKPAGENDTRTYSPLYAILS